ncbi:MAG: translation initiation factor IF-1 [Parcubacteria group bacterium Greene0416_14]|nr:MAG: translation initiation factor IF-1 [Parcubacteria group bacterium Greene0416_14]TSD01664.1 MAG: translation initiation factor IF-1 [Parcubacteria group bacterium Greene1014_15]TSD07808.1 MAG: translation initiation factor IF-1 [Parcubacteria group bacterium Greene0714_4]
MHPVDYNNKNREGENSIVGTVVEALPNTLFRIQTETGTLMIAYLSGKMRLHRIRVLVGDKVKIELDPYGGKGRINKRL